MIRAGHFVTQYVGEVISNEEAERRGEIYGGIYFLNFVFINRYIFFSIPVSIYLHHDIRCKMLNIFKNDEKKITKEKKFLTPVIKPLDKT